MRIQWCGASVFVYFLCAACQTATTCDRSQERERNVNVAQTDTTTQPRCDRANAVKVATICNSRCVFSFLCITVLLLCDDALVDLLYCCDLWVVRVLKIKASYIVVFLWFWYSYRFGFSFVFVRPFINKTDSNALFHHRILALYSSAARWYFCNKSFRMNERTPAIALQYWVGFLRRKSVNSDAINCAGRLFSMDTEH